MWLASLLTLGASAYELQESTFGWQAEPLDHAFVLNPGSFPGSVGSEADIEAAFLEGLSTWEDADAGLALPYGGRFTGGAVGGDGQLSARWGAGPARDFTIATATVWGTAGGQSVDCDIEFFGANDLGGPIAWSLGPAAGADLVETTAHEVGHCLGLGHASDPAAQMAPALRGVRGLIDDDIAGVQAIFDGPCPDGDGDGVGSCRDCDDANVLVHPDATERCDGIDNDCDGTVDTLATSTATFGASSYDIDRLGWGNAYAVDEDLVLHGFSAYLSLADEARVTWTLLVDDGATWTRLQTHTEVAPAGTGWFESPRFDRSFAAGDRILLIAGVEGLAAFHYGLGPGSTAEGLSPEGVAQTDWIPDDADSASVDPTFLAHQRVTVTAADEAPDLCGGSPGSGTGTGSPTGGSTSTGGASSGSTPPTSGSDSGSSCGSCAGAHAPDLPLVFLGGLGIMGWRRRR